MGMLTVAVELSKALVAARDGDAITLLCSRERPPALAGLDCEAVLAPYRHEVVLKARWLPMIETQVGADAILYPYWPSPPRRRPGAPPAAVYVHDLAFRLRPAEVPWQQRLYMGTVMGQALRSAGAVLVPSETTRRDVLAAYPLPSSPRDSARPRRRATYRSGSSPGSSWPSALSSRARTTPASWRRTAACAASPSW